MRAGRLLEIVLLLQARGCLTAQELADQCEVSVRTVYRDMRDLSAAGVPVYGVPRKDGGFRLVDGYQTRLTGLTENEARALFLAGAPAAAAALGTAHEATTARRKLLAATHAKSAEGQRVYLDPTEWTATPQTRWLKDLHEAVWNDRLIRIRYGTAPCHVTVAPLGLICKGTVWYLAALRDTDHRTYKVERIQELEHTTATFERPPAFDLAGHWAKAATDYTTTFHRTDITLRLHGEAREKADWVQASHRTFSEPDANGWATATYTVEDEDEALMAIALLGKDVEVVSPCSLRQRAVQAARAFASRNQD